MVKRPDGIGGVGLRGEPAGYFVLVPDASANKHDLDAADLIRRVLRGFWWVVAGVVIGTGIAAVRAFTSPPIYRPDAAIAIRADESGGVLAAMRGQFGGLASLAGIGLGGDSEKRKQALAVLKSRELAAEFVEKHQLMRLFFKGSWDDTTKSYNGSLFRSAPTVNDAVATFQSMCKIKEDAKTGLVTVGIEWIEPEVATEWVRDFIRMADEKLRSKAIHSASEGLKYLDRQLSETTREPIRQSLYRLMEGRLNETMLASVEPEYAFQIIDPPRIPDAKEYVRPKRLLQLAIGAVLGFALGVVIALWRHRRPESAG